MDIHVFWKGPFSLESAKEINDADRDYGVYQIYGHHPLYGSGVLLYIGQTHEQTFGKRISQEQWEYRADPRNTEVYFGYLAGQKTISNDEWNDRIMQVEKLLIYAHQPALNTQNTKTLPEEAVFGNNVYNWDAHRDLFPEVSGSRYTSRYDHISEENIYAFEKNIKP